MCTEVEAVEESEMPSPVQLVNEYPMLGDAFMAA
jgi:hypothetical protein